MSRTITAPRRNYLVTCIFSITWGQAQTFCPYLSAPPPTTTTTEQNTKLNTKHDGRSLYDSLSYYSEDDQTCTNNCFVNDGGNLNARHESSDGSTATTFDIMSQLSSNEYDGSDMCVFSFQELRLPNNQVSDENLLQLAYLGDSSGRRMYEFAQENSDNVLLAACTLGRIGASTACSNAKQGVDGYNYFSSDGDDDDSLSGTPTYYKDRFCKSAIRNSRIDHPHAITIFRLNSNDLENAQAALEEFREGHATNMQWAYETQIGADGHMLAKVVPCDQISDKFKNPSNMYQNLANDNSVCDYVDSHGKQFAQEALAEWENLCSVWPRNEDGSIPKCHKVRASSSSGGGSLMMWLSALIIGAAVLLHMKMRKKREKESSVDDSKLVTELS